MMDGSLGTDGKTPMDYDYNAQVTAHVVEMSHACGVSVEGELGCLGSLETGEAGEEDGVGAEGKLTHDQMLTDPDEAKQFVADTGVDALAIACGTSHGAYKFTHGDILAINRIKAIHASIPDTHLVMHGSSAVPQDWLAILTSTEAKSPRPTGCRLSRWSRALSMVSVRSTLIRIYDWRRRARYATFRSESRWFDPRKYFKESLVAMRDVALPDED